MFYSRGIQETSTVFNVKKMPGVGTKKDTQTGAPRGRKNSKRSCSNFSLHLHPHAYMFVNSVHRVYKENGSLFCPRIDGHATTTTTWRVCILSSLPYPLPCPMPSSYLLFVFCLLVRVCPRSQYVNNYLMDSLPFRYISWMVLLSPTFMNMTPNGYT